MKRTVLGLVGVLALAVAAPTGAAMAADLAVKAPMAPAPALFNWTGFYIGGNLGGAFAATSVSGSTLFDAPGGPFPSTFSGGGSASGLIGGGQIGVNYQFSTHWVIGLEADVDGTNFSGIGGDCSTNAAGIIVGCASVKSKLNDFGTVRGRFGYAGDNLLLYGTGGWAWSQSSTSSSLTCVVFSAGTACPGASDTFTGGSGSATTTATNGWAAGVGLEYAFWRNWVVRLEYLHLQFNGNGATLASSGTVGGAATPFTLTTSGNATTNIDIGRMGVSFLFH